MDESALVARSDTTASPPTGDGIASAAWIDKGVGVSVELSGTVQDGGEDGSAAAVEVDTAPCSLVVEALFSKALTELESSSF